MLAQTEAEAQAFYYTFHKTSSTSSVLLQLFPEVARYSILAERPFYIFSMDIEAFSRGLCSVLPKACCYTALGREITLFWHLSFTSVMYINTAEMLSSLS